MSTASARSAPSVDTMLTAVRCAKTVIAQFNKSMPRTLGDSFVHVSKIDYAVEVDQPPYNHVIGEIGAVERRIGEFVADLVPDEATLQMGIGAIPSAVGMCLDGKKDLGVHTEMFTDVLVDLVERGVVTCERKEINCGKIVTAFMMGTQRLYKFVDNNPMVEMRPVDYTNDTAVIRRFGA
jgi:4-hydroxybutyrate CoA-transferase